jgi:pimeloyl-ACP methyl ester carboxylesterase
MHKQFIFTILILLLKININAQHTYGSKYYGDAFVNYILAKNKTESATIVMIPGHNITSYIYSTTPDNRKGWAEMFADKGYNVYMVNDPKFDFATGGFVSPYSIPSGGKAATIGAVQAWQSDIWSRWGFGTSQGNPYTNAKFPTDSFAAFARNYPYLGTSSQRFEDAIEAVIDSIGGKVWILSHSAGTQPAVKAATTKKAKTNGIIVIEPAGPPDSTNFPALNGLHMFGVYGDYITSRNQTSRKAATEAAAVLFQNGGGVADVVSMPDDSSVFGNSHIMMQDNNNKYIFDVIELWLSQFKPQVPPVLGNIPNQNGIVNTNFNLALKPFAIITNGDSILNYSLSGSLPAGLSFNSSTGLISGIPTTIETKTMVASCIDDDGSSNIAIFDIKISSNTNSSIKSEIESIHIYPNPVYDVVFINSQYIIKEISIYNINGQSMENKIVENKINVSNLTKGVYFLKLTDQTGKNHTSKFVKE